MQAIRPWKIVLALGAGLMLLAAPGAARALEIDILYLERQVERPPTLSNLDPVPEDEGLAGARLGVADNATTGRFLGQDYALSERVIAPDEAFLPVAQEALSAGAALIIAHLPAEDLLALADLPGAQGALIVNASAPDIALRDDACRANVLHAIPSRSMLTDALAQFLLKRRWQRWMLIEGIRAGDAAYALALRRSAIRFGADIVAEKTWAFDADMRRNATEEVPVFTQGPEHDIVLVADEDGDFGRYVLYNTWEPRPVGGTEGLSPVAWSPAVEQWGAAQLQSRFVKQSARPMRAVDYGAWAAARVIGEAVTRTGSNDPAELRAYMLSPEFEFGGFKGRKMSFRTWNGQLRQPIPLVHPRAVAATAPLPGFLHERTELDTLGLDLGDSACTAFDTP